MSRPNTPYRIPKLSVRSRFGGGSGSRSDQNPDRLGSMGDADGAAPAMVPLETYPSHHNLRLPITHSTGPDSESSPPRRRSIVAPKAKKSSGLLRFLSLKEPSMSALNQLSEQQKKMARKGTRLSLIGKPGFSLKKLPRTVLKTNSQWDGMPETAKEKRKAKRGSTTSEDVSRKSNMTKSVSSSNESRRSSSSSSFKLPMMTGQSRKALARNSPRPPSIFIPPRRGSLQKGYSSGDPATWMASRAGPRKLSAVSSYPNLLSYSVPLNPESIDSLPEISCFFPTDWADAGEAEKAGKEDRGFRVETHSRTLKAFRRGSAMEYVPSPYAAMPASRPPNAAPLKEIPLSSSFPIESPDQWPLRSQSLPSQLGGRAYTHLPGSSPPPIPPKSPMRSQFPSSHSPLGMTKRSPSRTIQEGFLAGEAQPLELPDDDLDTGSDAESTHQHLLREVVEIPATRRSSAHIAMRTVSAYRASEPCLSSFYADSRAATPAPSDSISQHRRHVSIASFATTRSIIDDTSTVAPSIMSAQWYQTPQERLGLGGRITKADSVQWESGNPMSMERRKQSRFTMFRQ